MKTKKNEGKLYSFTSESVTEGHPDKVCDQISDAILDAYLRKDPKSRCAIETMVTKDLIILAGEISSKEMCNHEEIARSVVSDIGYNIPSLGFYSGSKVMDLIHKQTTELSDNDGAGDQGFVFGYACNQTKELMPLPIVLAHKLSKRLAEVRKENIVSGLFPDGKSQITVGYQNDIPQYIQHMIISTHHDERYKGEGYIKLKDEIIEKVILNTMPKELINGSTKITVNPNGPWFDCGGPAADTGLTGRKIIVDTYGGWARHGGGAFSGKDATKVDRTGAYLARSLAKHIVANGYTDECEIQLGFEIGNPNIVSGNINTFGTQRFDRKLLSKPKFDFDTVKKFLKEQSNKTIYQIIDELGLRKPIFRDLSNYCHFGREGYLWE
jgi:S-adenosylmethionine synthetase